MSDKACAGGVTESSVYDRPLLERIKHNRRMLPGGAELVAAEGFTPADGIEACGTCRAGTVWKDAGGVPRHPWCQEKQAR